MKRINRRMFTVIFTIASILINCMCSYLAGLVAFPLYLDSLLTIAVTALCGLIPGIVCAIASNALLCIFANTGILFMLCHISTAVVAHLVFYSERKKAKTPSNPNTPYTDVSYTTENFMWIGFISAITNSILGDTISYLFLLSKYLHSSSRQRRSRNICCNTELNICGILRRHRYKFNR